MHPASIAVVLGSSDQPPPLISMCALATNGKMKAGGSYFMISRSLGPEVGGAIGVVFFLANVLSTAFNVQGMCALLASNEAGSFTGFFSTPTGVNVRVPHRCCCSRLECAPHVSQF